MQRDCGGPIARHVGPSAQHFQSQLAAVAVTQLWHKGHQMLAGQDMAADAPVMIGTALSMVRTSCLPCCAS